VRFPCVHAIATTPARRLGSSLLLLLPQPCQPSPEWQPGRPAHRPFRGLFSVHSVTACTLAAATNLWLATPKASTASLPPQLLRLLPAGAFAGWDFHPPGKRRLSTAHANCGPSSCSGESSITYIRDSDSSPDDKPGNGSPSIRSAISLFRHRAVELRREGTGFSRTQARHLEPSTEHAADHGVIDHLPVVHHRHAVAEVLPRSA
jgi:hypothetical protein